MGIKTNLIAVQELMDRYEFTDGKGWKNDIETVIGSLSALLSEVLVGSSYYAYRNPTKTERNFNVSKLGIIGSTKNTRIMWGYPKKRTGEIELGINRAVYAHISGYMELPSPREVKPGKYTTEWVIRVDLPTLIMICQIFNELLD